MLAARLFLSIAFWGALAGAAERLDVNGAMPSMVQKYLEGIARPLWEARQSRVAGLRTPAAIAERQRWARAEFSRLLGGLPERTPLNIRKTGTLERDGYRVENIIFESMHSRYVACLWQLRCNPHHAPNITGTGARLRSHGHVSA